MNTRSVKIRIHIHLLVIMQLLRLMKSI